MNRRASLGALWAGLAGALVGRKAEAGGRKRYRAVFDLTADTPERGDAALRNVENLRQALGAGQVEAQVVVHGKAFPLVQKASTGMEERLRTLHQGGVRLSLCRNTMKRFEVAPETLLPFVDTVDAAVAELVRKQEAGWAYIKPG